MEKKLTVYQKLNKVFGPEGIKVPIEKTNRYSVGHEEISRTKSKPEYETDKLQAQQTRYLSQLWQKVDGEMYQQSIHYEITRVASYSDFENMEFFPEIAAAMDIIAEEATTLSEKGKVMNIYSESKRVKHVLEDLFFNRLDIHTSLYAWARNTVKYGDNFCFLNIDDKAGIIGVRQMPNFEMERREGDLFGSLIARTSTSSLTIGGQPKTEYDNKVRFYWKTKNIEFNSWQMAHFRLLGDDRRLPYGTCLKSDTYINTENGVKEIKDINKGDKVFSFDVNTEKNILSTVLDTVHSGKKQCYKLSTENSEVIASEEHNIMYYNADTKTYSYKNVLDFKTGDLLVINKNFKSGNITEDKFVLEPMISIEKDGEFETYDIYVDNENHNFYANGVVVHNSMLEKARRIWKQCVDENTNVWTEKGYKKIKEITKDDVIYSYDYINKELIKNNVIDCWKTGDKEVFGVRTRYGTIDVTDNHKILTYNGKEYQYKTINDIKIDKDFLVTPTIKDTDKNYPTIRLDESDYYIKLNDKGLKKSKEMNRVGILKIVKSIDEKNYKNVHRFLQGEGVVKYYYIYELERLLGITLDDVDLRFRNGRNLGVLVNKKLEYQIDDKFIHFFGFMLGDGWLNRCGIGFALGIYDDRNEYYINYVTSTLRDHMHINQAKHSIYSKSVILDSLELKNIFLKLGFITGFAKKEIPNWVYELNLLSKRKFIEGLFDADGSAKYNIIGLANKKLITDLKELCLQSGIACGKIGVNPASIKFNKKTGKTETRQESYRLYINFNNVKDELRHERILSIISNGVKPVWDLTTESKLHNFIGNSFVVHNCLLAEDAMLTYRVTRAPERRVYKIYVGNIDDKDIPAYVNEIANRFKRTPVIDPQTGQMDLRMNQMPVWRNTPIPLLDGRTITIEDLAKEYDGGKENYVYSVQDKTHQIVAGKVDWCGKNYRADKMIKVWLDDDTYVVTAAEHPFIMRDGTKKRADELNSGDSLMPFYSNEKKLGNGKYAKKYETIYNPNSGKFEYTHRLIAEEIEKKKDSNTTVHHKNFLNRDNRPINLEWFDWNEHIAFHGELAKQAWAEGKHEKTVEELIKYNKSEKKRLRNIELAKEQNWAARFIPYNHSELHTEHNAIRREAQLNDWSNPEKKASRSKGMQIKFDDFIWTEIKSNILGKRIINRKTLIEFMNTEPMVDYTISINKNDRLNNQRRIERTVIERNLSEIGFNTTTDYIKAQLKNHKVKFTEIVDGDDVYCMRVMGVHSEDDRHNFAVLSFKNDGEINVSGSFLGNSNEQDYFIPVRDENAPNPIDTLPGASNLDQIEDIEFLQRKLFTALRVPKPFLGFESTVGDGNNLALQDIRFSRTINRVQQALLMELNKIAIIHLYVLGFEDDLDNFTLTLNNPSTQAEMLKVEHLQAKITLFHEAVRDSGGGFGAMSITRAKKDILGYSADEIKQDLLEQRMEKAAKSELERTAQLIKHTGFFDKVDNIYADPAALEKERKGELSAGGEQEEGAPGGGGGGGFGGGGMGGGEELGAEDLGGPAEEGATGATAGAGGEAGAGGTSEAGAEMEMPETEPAGAEETKESIEKVEKLLMEKKERLQKTLTERRKKYETMYMDRLINSIQPTRMDEEKDDYSTKIYDKSLKINEDINGMIDEIDKKLNEG